MSVEEKMAELTDSLISLEEEKVRLINEAVTEGLRDDVEYCESGIQWIGKMPSHWKIEKGKYLLTKLDRSVKEDDGVVTCFRDGEVTLRSKRREEGFTISEKEIGYQGIEVGDLVVHGMDGFAGAIGISDSRGKGSPILNVLDTTMNKGFLMYYLRNMAYSEVFTGLATGIRVRSCDLRWEKLANLEFPVPPIEEQIAIAEYLNKKCAEIDDIIGDIKNQIKTLKQERDSVVAEALTNGLVDGVEMKETTLPWASKIPAHWEVMPNKYIMRKLKNICEVHNGEDIISLSMNGVIVRDLDAGGKMPTSFDGYQFVYPGNLLMCLFDYDVTPRCIGYINNYGVTSPAYSQFEMLNDNYALFYYYYYLMMDNTKELLHLAKNLRHSFSEEEFGRILAIVPPIEEQIAIAEYLNKKCAEIDDIIGDKEKQLELLESYKKSLIFEIVTGKRGV